MAENKVGNNTPRITEETLNGLRYGRRSVQNAVIGYVLDSFKEDQHYEYYLNDNLSDVFKQLLANGSGECVPYLADERSAAEWYDDNKDEIGTILLNQMIKSGAYGLPDFFSSEWNRDDPLALSKANQALLARFAFDTKALEIWNKIAPTSLEDPDAPHEGLRWFVYDGRYDDPLGLIPMVHEFDGCSDYVSYEAMGRVDCARRSETRNAWVGIGCDSRKAPAFINNLWRASACCEAAFEYEDGNVITTDAEGSSTYIATRESDNDAEQVETLRQSCFAIWDMTEDNKNGKFTVDTDTEDIEKLVITYNFIRSGGVTAPDVLELSKKIENKLIDILGVYEEDVKDRLRVRRGINYRLESKGYAIRLLG